MAKTIKETQWYKVVYDRLHGVLKFIRKRDNAHSYWATGHFAQDLLSEAKQMTPKQLNEKAQNYKYYA